MMKRLIILFCGTLVLTACGNGIEKKTNERPTIARTVYECGDYEEAKTQIGNIEISYPKASEARRAGQELTLDVKFKAQQEILVFLDSALRAKQAASDAIKGKYILERDAEHQQMGNYIWPTQAIEKNLHRSLLRFQVNEQGIMGMTSIYCGAGNIHHVGVKVTTLGGSLAETPVSKDSCETSDMNEKIEKADYKLGEDGNMIEFLDLNKDKNIHTKFTGGRRYAATMSPTGRQAAADVYELPKILSAIRQIKKEQEDANLKIGFTDKKKEQKAIEEAAEEQRLFRSNGFPEER